MKGFLRIYQEGDEIISKLQWGAIQDNYLNFYKDKKSRIPSSVIDLKNSEVSSIFSDQYKAEFIQITSENNNKILITPENIKDFDIWKTSLMELSYPHMRSMKVNSVPKIDKANIESYNYPHSQTLPSSRKSQNKYMNEPSQYSTKEIDENPDLMDTRQRYVRNNYTSDRPRDVKMKPNNSPIELMEQRKFNDDNRYRPSTPTRNSKYDQLESKKRKRNIDTVKEDPNMSDNEIMETKTLEELRKKYPISDKTKRWSIAATDIIGKSNNELFIMLIQLNREKSHMDIWKETLENQIGKVEIALKNVHGDREREELENSYTYLTEQLGEMDYMINLAHPLISFLESVVQMSDVYKGDNQTFHVVYHHTFIYFSLQNSMRGMRFNSDEDLKQHIVQFFAHKDMSFYERGILKLTERWEQHPPSGKEDFSNIDFIRHNQEKEVAKLINEDQFQSPSLRYNSLKKVSHVDGKENDPDIFVNFKLSQKFLDRRKILNEVLEEIEAQILKLDPLKTSVEGYVKSFDDNKTDISNVSGGLSATNKSLVRDSKLKKGSETKMTDLAMMPRRSTRKAPKSDMLASLNRSGKAPRPTTPPSQPSYRRSLHEGHSLSYKGVISAAKSENELFKDPDDFEDYSVPKRYNHLSSSLKEPKFQKTNDHTNKEKDRNVNKESRLQGKLWDLVNGDTPSPVVNERNKITPEFCSLDDEPLIKLNANRYQNIHRPNRPNPLVNISRQDSQNSLTNSDISRASTLINQRMHLNENFLDNKKMWKSTNRNDECEDKTNAECKADYIIKALLETPAKMKIVERYRDSISSISDIDVQRSDRIRKQVVKESMSGYTESEIGERNERESMLLRNALLAQEASKRSRQL